VKQLFAVVLINLLVNSLSRRMTVQYITVPIIHSAFAHLPGCSLTPAEVQQCTWIRVHCSDPRFFIRVISYWFSLFQSVERGAECTVQTQGSLHGLSLTGFLCFSLLNVEQSALFRPKVLYTGYLWLVFSVSACWTWSRVRCSNPRFSTRAISYWFSLFQPAERGAECTVQTQGSLHGISQAEDSSKGWNCLADL
jgi:hypothetical protein